jgi:hypothetical protein
MSSGTSQSSINITSASTVWTELSGFAVSVGYGIEMAGKLRNNGHTGKRKPLDEYKVFILV